MHFLLPLKYKICQCNEINYLVNICFQESSNIYIKTFENKPIRKDHRIPLLLSQMCNLRFSLITGKARLPSTVYKPSTRWYPLSNKNRSRIYLRTVVLHRHTQAHTCNHNHIQTQKCQCVMSDVH